MNLNVNDLSACIDWVHDQVVRADALLFCAGLCDMAMEEGHLFTKPVTTGSAYTSQGDTHYVGWFTKRSDREFTSYQLMARYCRTRRKLY